MSDFFHSPYTAAPAATSPTEPIYVAVDVGSTQTRSSIFTKEAQFSDYSILDSNYEILSRDIERIASPGDDFISGLELILTDLSADKKVDPIFQELHVVKGDLLSAISGVRQLTAASASKIDQEATYINIVSNLAIQVLQHFKTHGATEDLVPVNLTVSLPPEDTRFKQRIETFKQRLVGDYEVNFVRFNTIVRFTILPELNITSEPEAVTVLLSVTEQLEDTDDSVVCVLDIGGRSAGIIFIDNKQLKKDSCITVSLGGSHLVNILGRQISDTLNIQEPKPDRLSKAISTGVYKLGAQKVDIIPQLNAAKEEFGRSICSELIRAVDMNGFQMQDISKVVCSGRTFGEAPGSPSLMNVIEKMFNSKSAYAKFEKIEQDNPILAGLIYHGIFYA